MPQIHSRGLALLSPAKGYVTRCPMDRGEEARSTRGRWAQAVAQAQARGCLRLVARRDRVLPVERMAVRSAVPCVARGGPLLWPRRATSGRCTTRHAGATKRVAPGPGPCPPGEHRERVWRLLGGGERPRGGGGPR